MLLDSTVRFLTKILPNEGWICSRRERDNKVFWAQSIEELARIILDQDAQGESMHHACASYKAADRKRQIDVHAVRSLWVDIDVGAEKTYKTFQDACTAAQSFLEACKLPKPVLVASGYGIHMYWPLVNDISVDEWAMYAGGISEACDKAKLDIDAQRTRDVSSTLRTPGTHNRKYTESRLVQWSGDVGPYDIKLFDGIKITPKKKGESKNDLKADPTIIATQCAQIANFRDLKGRISEPEWKACLSVLAFCKDGDTHAHEWSKGDERYDETQTQSKIDASKLMSGPTTCAYFDKLNSKCVGCPFKGQITTPAQLGVTIPTLTPEQLVFAKELQDDEVKLVDVGPFGHVGGQLVFKYELKDGRPGHTKITQYPVVVETVTKGEFDIDNYSVALKFKTPHEDWKTTIISLRGLFGSSGVADVMGRGIVVHNGDLFKQYVRESMDYLNAARKAEVQYDQFGWKNDDTEFLVGDRLYKPEGVVAVSSGRGIKQRAITMGPTKNGSLDQWRDAVNKLFATGFEAQGFAVLAAFSTPFMRWQAAAEGGAILSLVSRKSGKGKTTALTAAASVWGSLEALKQTNSDTSVSRGIMLGMMGNLPVIRDEYTQRDPEVLRQEVQIFTEGRDKLRATSEGSLGNGGASWQTILIAGSNTSLLDTLRAAKNGEAMARRVVEFQVDIPKDVEHWKGDELKNIINANAGHAGDLFLRTILHPQTLDHLKGLLPRVREDLIKKHGLVSDQRFVARLLAGVAVAGVIVKKLGIVDFSIDRIMDWAQCELFERPAFEAVHDEPFYMLARFLAENIDSTLIVPDAFRPMTTMVPLHSPKNKLFIRKEVKPNKLFIEIKQLRSWMQKEEQSWRHLIEDLTFKGLITNPHRMVTLSAGTPFSTGQVPCIELKADHPMLSGVLKEIERFEVKENVG